MCSAGSKAPANSPGHRQFWSFFHLKQTKPQVNCETSSTFALAFPRQRSQGALALSSERCFQTKIYINSLESLMLPKTKQKTHLGHSCFPGALQWGSRLVSSALGTLQGPPITPCLGNLACKYSALGIIPLKDLPICPAEEKLF